MQITEIYKLIEVNPTYAGLACVFVRLTVFYAVPVRVHFHWRPSHER